MKGSIGSILCKWDENVRIVEQDMIALPSTGARIRDIYEENVHSGELRLENHTSRVVWWANTNELPNDDKSYKNAINHENLISESTRGVSS